MQFDTKIAVVIRTDLEAVAEAQRRCVPDLGIAAAFPECIGEPYDDGSGTQYLSLIGQPILIYGADRPQLSRALERALARNVKPAVYTEDMFKTTHDAANREAVQGGDPRRAQSGRARDARRAQGDRQDRRRAEVSQLAASGRRLAQVVGISQPRTSVTEACELFTGHPPAINSRGSGRVTDAFSPGTAGSVDGLSSMFICDARPRRHRTTLTRHFAPSLPLGDSVE